MTEPVPTPTPSELLALALPLVRAAGELARDGRDAALARFDGKSEIDSKSTPTDIVTEMDRAAERLIVEGLREARPSDAVLGEEGGAQGAAGNGVRWVLDPIDGTVNYVYGLRSTPSRSPPRSTGRSSRAWCTTPRQVRSGRRSSVAGRGGAAGGCPGRRASTVEQALVGTGFGYDAGRRAEQARVVAALLPKVRDIRRFGAASLDLCFVAEGRLDAYYEGGLNHWDRAAGGLIAEEAGVLVTGLRGAPAGPAMTLAAPAELSRRPARPAGRPRRRGQLSPSRARLSPSRARPSPSRARLPSGGRAVSTPRRSRAPAARGSRARP